MKLIVAKVNIRNFGFYRTKFQKT